MKRRDLLAGSTGLTVLVGGCLRGGDVGDTPAGEPSDDDGSDRSGDEATDDVAYERCENRVVHVSRLPEPAQEETLAAISDDGYETDDDLLLPDVILIDDAYLEDDDVYYEPTVTDDGDTMLIDLSETLPTFEEEVTLENLTGEDRTVDISIEHEETDEVLLEETITLEVGESVTLSDDVEFPYGTYHGKIEGDDLAEDGSWEITWELDPRFESGYDYPLELDDNGVFEDPVDRDSTDGPCVWDDDGTVNTGR